MSVLSVIRDYCCSFIFT